MNVMKIVWVLILIVVTACERNTCVISKKNSAIINDYFEKVDLSVGENDMGLSGESIKALYLLEALTGIESMAEIGDISYYESKRAYKLSLIHI